ncbi:MAG: hypothetical protein JWO53_126 [Chlamydiia bacterium]|nr:hypothetical protein [Chlamydiia bacterium]
MGKYLTTLCLFFGCVASTVQAETKKPSSPVTVEQITTEITELDALIKATENNLARQKQLRPLLEEYRKIEKACLSKPSDTALLFKLAKQGKIVYEAIHETHLTAYFKPEFIQELHKLKTIADKKSIPPAK